MAYRPSIDFTLCLLAVGFIVLVSAVGLSNVSGCGPGKSTTDARQLGQGIEKFDQAYGRLPQFGSGSRETLTNSAAGIDLLTILLGREEETDSMQNKRRLPFVNFKETTNKKKGGLVYSDPGLGGRPQGLYDSWGKPFRVFVRPPESADLVFTYGGKAVVLKETLVAIVSSGPDGEEGNKDDIRTW